MWRSLSAMKKLPSFTRTMEAPWQPQASVFKGGEEFWELIGHCKIGNARIEITLTRHTLLDRQSLHFNKSATLTANLIVMVTPTMT